MIFFFLSYKLGIEEAERKAVRKDVYLHLNGNDLINRGALFPDVTLGAYL